MLNAICCTVINYCVQNKGTFCPKRELRNMNIEFNKSEISDAEKIIFVKANAFKEEVKMYGHCPNENDSVEKENLFYETHGFVKVGQTQPREDGFFLFLYERTRQ